MNAGFVKILWISFTFQKYFIGITLYQISKINPSCFDLSCYFYLQTTANIELLHFDQHMSQWLIFIVYCYVIYNHDGNIKGGVQASQFGKLDFQKWVEGEGQDPSRYFGGGIGSMHAMLPMWGFGAKMRSKNYLLNLRR